MPGADVGDGENLGWKYTLFLVRKRRLFCRAAGWRNAWRAVGRTAIKFYYQIKPHSQENASLLGVPPKQYLQVLHLSKLRRRAAMNFPCLDLKQYSYISALMWRKISRSLEQMPWHGVFKIAGGIVKQANFELTHCLWCRFAVCLAWCGTSSDSSETSNVICPTPSTL